MINETAKFIVDNPEDCVQRHHVKGEFYTVHELRIMREFTPDNATIIDIGANVGNHTVYFSKYFNPKIVYAIEPIEKACQMLLKNLELNNCKNVNTDYLGVGFAHVEATGYPYQIYKNNFATITIFPEPTTFMKADDQIHDPFPPVKMIRGDSIFANIHVDLIKIDVEWMEMVVLEGLKETIARSRPNMFIEINNRNKFEFENWLIDNNYSSIRSHPDSDAIYHMVVSNEAR